LPKLDVRVEFDVGGRLPDARKRYSVEITRTFTRGTGKFESPAREESLRSR